MRTFLLIALKTLIAATTAATPTPQLPGAGPSRAHQPSALAKPQSAAGTLLIGDSMMRIGVGPALKQALPGGHIEIRAKSATGLARPDVFDWPAEVAKLVAHKRFERVIVFIGSNDCQTLAGPGGGAVFGTHAWEDAYRGRLRQMLGRLCEATDDVVWLGLPPMRSPKFNGRIAALNTVLESAIDAAPCARFVPTGEALADGKGGFATYRKVRQHRLKIRDDDGVHITPTGGQLVADAVLAELAL